MSLGTIFDSMDRMQGTTQPLKAATTGTVGREIKVYCQALYDTKTKERNKVNLLEQAVNPSVPSFLIRPFLHMFGCLLLMVFLTKHFFVQTYVMQGILKFNFKESLCYRDACKIGTFMITHTKLYLKT